jgi:hypothetical protein
MRGVLQMSSKNPIAVELGRLGGKAKSARKTEANRAKSRAYWQGVRERRRLGLADENAGQKHTEGSDAVQWSISDA